MRSEVLILATVIMVVLSGPVDECPILQTTDPRTPCHIRIDQSLQSEPIPPFVYMINLPGPTAQQPCPFVQTLDAAAPCYMAPNTRDDPALILRVPLPPRADELDESPAGIAKLREAKFKSLMATSRPLPTVAKPVSPTTSLRTAGVPLTTSPAGPQFEPLPQGDPQFTVAYSPSAPIQPVAVGVPQPQPTAPIVYSPPPQQNYVQSISFPYSQSSLSSAQSAPSAPHQYYGLA